MIHVQHNIACRLPGARRSRSGGNKEREQGPARGVRPEPVGVVVTASSAGTFWDRRTTSPRCPRQQEKLCNKRVTTAPKSAYDNLDNRLMETDPLGNKTSYTYNTFGKPLTINGPEQSRHEEHLRPNDDEFADDHGRER